MLRNSAAFPLIAVVLSAVPVQAQQEAATPLGRDTRSAQQLTAEQQFSTTMRDSADKLTAKGDTSAAVKLLRSATEKASRNPELWHHYGMLLYAWTRPHWRVAPMPAGVANRIIAAESSLARAMTLAPDSIDYAIDYARNLFAANNTSLGTSQRVQSKALTHATALADTQRIAQIADNLGMLLWRRYEMDAEDLGPNLGAAGFRLNSGDATEAAATSMRLGRASESHNAGEASYSEALEHFRYVLVLTPDSERAFRHVVMALSQRWRWDEVATVAREQIRNRPNQPWPWLALGLSEQRQWRYAQAAAAFDSGFSRLDSIERNRLFSLKRLLKPSQEASYDTMPTPAKQQLEALYWSSNDPSLLLPGNPLRTEFLARVVYAELMWTADERGMRGAESDKGQVQIRWGPADLVGPYVYIPNMGWFSKWRYTSLGLTLRFRQSWGTGVSTLFFGITREDIKRFENAPSGFTNVPIMKRGIENIAMQVARFRGVGDSLDMLVFTEVPVGRLRGAAETESSRMPNGFFALDESGDVIARCIDTLTVIGHDISAEYPKLRRWRLPPSVTTIRAEAVELDQERIARSMSNVSGFSTTGFGLSDLLIAERVTAKNNNILLRWNEYDVDPLEHETLARNAPIDLLWENYGLASRGGNSTFRVSVSTERIDERGAKAVAARVLSDLRGAIAGRPSPDMPSISYERTIPSRDAFAEALRIELQGARSGRYRVTLRITDLVTGAEAVRVRHFVVQDQ